MTLNKSTVEDVTLTWFDDLGYGVARGPDLAPGEATYEGAEFDAAALVGNLSNAIRRPPPDLLDKGREEALRRAPRVNGTKGFLEANQ
jgi:type I restriction enzyme, R subunit